MKLKNIKNRPVLIEYDDVAMALPPKGTVDVGKKFSKSIKRALDSGDVRVIEEKGKKESGKKPEKKQVKKAEEKPKKKVEEKPRRKVEEKPKEKVEENVEDGGHKGPKKKKKKSHNERGIDGGGGLKSIKDLREDGSG